MSKDWDDDSIPSMQIDSTDEDADWIKLAALERTGLLPFMEDDTVGVEEYRAGLERRGRTVESFKQLAVYRHAMKIGKPHWIAEL